MVTAELGACEWFVYELRRSNSIDRGQLDQIVGEFLKRNMQADAPALAQHLVQQKVLTPFQSERVLANKAQGLVLGPYVLTDALGSGSMGTVYRALSKTDGKDYAIKVLPRRSMWNVRLSQATGSLLRALFNHAAVVRFVDVGTSAWYAHTSVWPMVDGETLDALMAGSADSRRSRPRIGVQIASASRGLPRSEPLSRFAEAVKHHGGADFQSLILDFGIGCLLAENEGESLVDTMSYVEYANERTRPPAPKALWSRQPHAGGRSSTAWAASSDYCVHGAYPFPDGSAVEEDGGAPVEAADTVKELAAEFRMNSPPSLIA